MKRSWISQRVRPYTNSVFEDVTALARRFDAVNLGSGTPSTPIPKPLQDAVAEAIAEGRNQYSPVQGEIALRQAVAEHAARFYGQHVDPINEVTITNGVTEALHASLLSLIDPGDEVVVFEPFYDCYVPGIRMAGATPAPVTLHAPTYRFDPRELRAAFSPRTRAIILNTPHNPTGTVFSREELCLVAELCRKFDVLAICDEVYEHVVFDGARHLRLATFPGMRERTLTLSGAGKTFGCTGWRIGWAIGSEHFHEALRRLRQFTVFAAPTPFQFAIAVGLRFADAYFERLAADYQSRRDYLIKALAACRLKPRVPAGAFFILTDISSYPSATGREFANDLAKACGVAPLPLDTLYINQHYGERIARFTFCVPQELLETAGARLARLNTGCPAAR